MEFPEQLFVLLCAFGKHFLDIIWEDTRYLVADVFGACPEVGVKDCSECVCHGRTSESLHLCMHTHKAAKLFEAEKFLARAIPQSEYIDNVYCALHINLPRHTSTH